MFGYDLERWLFGYFRLFALILVAMASGCSSTRVVLMPDPDGKVGEVTVMTDKGTRVLTEAGESTLASSAIWSDPGNEVLQKMEIQKVFAVALENEPLPPERHMLYFDFDTTELRPQSLQKLPKIYQRIGLRQLCDVSVNGHTDRMGAAAYNQRLSMRRAHRVQNELIKLGLDETCVKIRYYGESDPLVPTRDGVAKKVNRRVEIEIR